MLYRRQALGSFLSDRAGERLVDISTVLSSDLDKEIEISESCLKIMKAIFVLC